MYIDTHCHINFKEYKTDADQVIRAALNEETWMINVGSNYKSSKRALEYANRYERGVYAAVGLHPIHLQVMRAQGDDYDFMTQEEDFNFDIYEKLAKFEKVVAIGEIGLEYYHIDSAGDVGKIKDKQKEVFWAQLYMARQLDLPVIIHCRNAHDDMIDLLADFKKEYNDIIPKNKAWGVMHCFSGDEDLAWKYFQLGLIISFTGNITFSKQYDNLIRKLPNDKFMIETDSPYLTPEPLRGQRNEPINVKYVAERIAEIKNLSTERIAEISTKNAREFFRI
jgi:TatD DNase family protein